MAPSSPCFNESPRGFCCPLNLAHPFDAGPCFLLCGPRQGFTLSEPPSSWKCYPAGRVPLGTQRWVCV